MKPRQLKTAVILFLIVATIAVYWQVFNHDFVNYDDDEYVAENRHVQTGLSWKGIVWAFTTFHASNWHPLTWLSHMLDCDVFGLYPGGHHLVSLLFHIANTLLLFLVFERMTGALWQSAFVSAIFALHPLHVESVAWVAERKDVLSAFFWLASMGAYVRYVESPGLTRYLLVLVLFSVGLMAKPMLVTLPFVLLLIDYWPLERLRTGHSEPQAKPHKSVGPSYQMSGLPHLIREKVPLFALAAVSCVVTISAQHAGGAVRSLDVLPFHVRVANALVAYVTYIGKTVWPLNLAVFYPHPGMRPLWQPIGATLLLICISSVAIRMVRRSPYFPVGWFWYLGTLVPVIGIIQVGNQSMADRYTYLPLIGLSILIAWGAAELVTTWRQPRFVLAASASVVLLVLTVCAWLQARHWHNSVALFKHTIGVTSANDLAHNSLGNALSDQGRLDEAISHYTEALKINPRYARAHNNLGVALNEQGKLDEAISHYYKALEINPDYVPAHSNLGVAFYEQGKLDEAISHCYKALEINPDSARAHNNLGNALSAQGRLNEAISHYTEALRIDPDCADAHHNLANALARQGKLDEATSHYTEALSIDPDQASTHRKLANVVSEQARLQEAIEHYSKDLQVAPSDASVHNKLGIALARQGRLDKAIEHFSGAVRISPDDAVARKNLERALRLSGKPDMEPGTSGGDQHPNGTSF